MKPYLLSIIVFTIVAGVFLFLVLCAIMYKNYFSEFSKEEDDEMNDIPPGTLLVYSCRIACPDGMICYCTCGKSLEERLLCKGREHKPDEPD